MAESENFMLKHFGGCRYHGMFHVIQFWNKCLDEFNTTYVHTFGKLCNKMKVLLLLLVKVLLFLYSIENLFQIYLKACVI